MRSFRCLLSLALIAATALPAAAQLDDEMEFFREAAQFITASRRAIPRHKAPASVSVVTAEDIKLSGAVTLWDALRLVPGVDVVETRAGQGDVSIRGFNQSTSNRLLVLLDGKTVLQEFYGLAAWEEIPVAMAEIDRIEIVKGPASALYGANAIHGVINIITKTPAQVNGGSAGYAAGNRATRLGTAVYGRQAGKLSYKVSAEHRAMDSFEDPGHLASRVAKAHALLATRTPATAWPAACPGLTTGWPSTATAFGARIPTAARCAPTSAAAAPKAGSSGTATG